MASVAGQPRFSIFEITPVGILVALAGGVYLMLFSRILIRERPASEIVPEGDLDMLAEPGLAGGQIGSASSFAEHVRFRPAAAVAAATVFVSVVVLAALEVAPIAACAFAGAILLILMRVLTAEEAYSGLRPEVLMLVAGMVVLGIALDVTGLAGSVTSGLIQRLNGLSPLVALIIIYGVTLFATELLSNATVAVLFTPIAVALAEALQVSPRPFLVAVMVAGSAAFATPFGYQTNVLVYQMGGYNYLDFVKIGIPLNLITWVVGVAAISFYFPF
jgi:di/tricarboxylate transporter